MKGERWTLPSTRISEGTDDGKQSFLAFVQDIEVDRGEKDEEIVFYP